jgi:hypothetical protein
MQGSIDQGESEAFILVEAGIECRGPRLRGTENGETIVFSAER